MFDSNCVVRQSRDRQQSITRGVHTAPPPHQRWRQYSCRAHALASALIYSNIRQFRALDALAAIESHTTRVFVVGGFSSEKTTNRVQFAPAHLFVAVTGVYITRCDTLNACAVLYLFINYLAVLYTPSRERPNARHAIVPTHTNYGNTRTNTLHNTHTRAYEHTCVRDVGCRACMKEHYTARQRSDATHTITHDSVITGGVYNGCQTSDANDATRNVMWCGSRPARV